MKIKLTPLQQLGIFILVIVTVWSFWGLIRRFDEGLILTNLTQHVPWGIWVAVYIYFIGLSAGSFLLSTMIYVFGVKKMEPVGGLALVQALVCLLLGGIAIVVDLGHPERMANVLLNGSRTSILAWEAYFYAIYALIILAELYFVLRPGLAMWAREKRPLWRLYKILAFGDEPPSPQWHRLATFWLLVLGVIGIPAALGVHGGTGSIFAVVKARAYWFGGLFPIIFLISAMASGGGLLTFLTATLVKLPRKQKQDLVLMLGRLTIGILVVDMILLSSEMLTTMYGGIPDEVEVWQYILTSESSWLFWGLELGVGVVIPLLLVGLPFTGRSITGLGIAGLCVVVGMIGTRLNIVLPALILPVLEPFRHGAFPNHLRWSMGYYPSLNEYLVGAAVIVMGIWMFIIAFNLLPLRGEMEALHSKEGEHAHG